MARVTKITPQKRKGFFSVFIDNEYSFSLDEEKLLEASLRIDDELTDADVAHWKKVSEDVKVYHALILFLTVRPRSTREVEQYLRFRRKVREAEVIQQFIARVQHAGYLDDQAFAKWWVEQRGAQGKGTRLIKQELFNKGVGREIVEEALTAHMPDELSSALHLAQKRILRYSPLSDIKKKSQLQSFLQRRGYSWDIVKQVVSTLQEEQ